MTRLAFSVLFLLLSVVGAQAQLRQVAKIDTLAKAVYADNLDQVYLLTEKDEIIKYDQKGVLRWRYSNTRFGKLQSVDVSDPLRIVLFYADFQQVVVLNNNLTEIVTYSFANNSSMLISAVASANNNSLWVFDRSENALLRLSSVFNEESKSPNLYQLFDQMVDVKKMISSDQLVFIQPKAGEILVFDRFGAFVKTLPLADLPDFGLSNHFITYQNENLLTKYNTISSEITKVQLPVLGQIKQVALGNKIIAVLTEKAVFLLSDN